jgi:hypothetical protein
LFCHLYTDPQPNDHFKLLSFKLSLMFTVCGTSGSHETLTFQLSNFIHLTNSPTETQLPS